MVCYNQKYIYNIITTYDCSPLNSAGYFPSTNSIEAVEQVGQHDMNGKQRIL